jgi:hypothetical protein
MSEQPQVINIDNVPYLVDDISDTCKQMLNTAQQTNAGIDLLAALLNAAQKGADLNMKEAVKLLPDPYAADQESTEAH